MDNARYEHMTKIMKAMAHPTRLYIIDKLSEREYCVCELQEFVKADMSTVSRHLAVLKNAGIIDNRKQNNQVFYKLLCPCVLDVYKCIVKMK